MKKFKKSTYLPLILFIYLAVLAYIGRDILLRGEYTYYFSVVGLSILVIVLLHFSLKRKEKMKSQNKASKDNNSKIE